jgi:DNA-binding NarL/FixJ family response regulator
VGELVQNDPNANLAGQAGEARIPNGSDVAALAPVGAFATRRPFAAVLIGRGGLFQEGLASILSDTDFRIVASACGVDGLVLSLLPQDQRLLLIVDAGDDLSHAAGQIELFRDRHPTARVAVLTDADQIGDLLLLFRAGAHACFARGVTRDVLLKSLELVALGETFLLPGVLPLIRDRQESATPVGVGAAAAKGACLSAQEKCVLRCLAEGDSNKVIANKIDIAVATVKVHVNSIFRKIGTCNRTQAAIWARNNISQDEPAGERAPLPAAAPSTPAEDPAPVSEGEIISRLAVEEPPMTPPAGEAGVCDVKQDSSKEDALKKPGLRSSAQEEIERRAQRRLAEEEERRAEMVAKTNHLRELRKAREAAEHKGLTCATGNLSPDQAPIKALIPLNPSQANVDERSSQHSGIRLA